MIKKFNLNLKEPHLEIINKLKEKLSLTNNEEVVNLCIRSALKLNNNDLIFSTIKEKCRGGCFGSLPHFEIEIEKDTFKQLRKIYTRHNFDNYKTDEEEVGKVIRCIINYFEDETELIKF